MTDKTFSSRLKNTRTEITQFVDRATGEDMGDEEEKFWRVEVAQDNFLFVYGRLISALKDIPEVEIKVFLCLCECVDFGTCDLRMSKSLYVKISAKLGYVEGTVRNAMPKLTQSGLLIKHPKLRGHYRVNPEFVWKGKQSGRIDAMKKLLIEIKEKQVL